MTLVQLRHLISVAETGSFTRSSELLCLTQPALSRSIRALEEELGQAIFDRVGRHTEITPFGVEFLRRARALVKEAEDLLTRSKDQQNQITSTLRVGMSSSPAAVLTTVFLKTMASRHPTIHVEIARGNSDRLVRALRERQLDAIIVDPRSLPAAADLEVSCTVSMRGAIMCRPDHPLARRNSPLPFSALRQYVMATTPWSDEVGRELAGRYGALAHLNECITLLCDDLRSMIDLARDSDVLLLAIRAAAPELVELALDPPLQTKARYAVVTLAGRAEAPATPLVRKLVEKYLRD
jgi:DNA-binding transcriptional LysR family regulator